MSYNNLNEVEQYIYHEYKSWCKVAKEQNPYNFEYALIQVNHFLKRAMDYPRLKEILLK